MFQGFFLNSVRVMLVISTFTRFFYFPELIKTFQLFFSKNDNQNEFSENWCFFLLTNKESHFFPIDKWWWLETFFPIDNWWMILIDVKPFFPINKWWWLRKSMSFFRFFFSLIGICLRKKAFCRVLEVSRSIINGVTAFSCKMVFQF